MTIVILLCSSLSTFEFAPCTRGHLLIDGLEKETLSKIRKCTNLDKEVIKALRSMKGEKKKSIRGGKVYVPRDEELRKEIMHLHHNTSISGHPGCWKMLELVMRNYWWPGISKYVLSYVDGV